MAQGVRKFAPQAESWVFLSQTRQALVVKTGSDSFTAERSAISVSVTDSLSYVITRVWRVNDQSIVLCRLVAILLFPLSAFLIKVQVHVHIFKWFLLCAPKQTDNRIVTLFFSPITPELRALFLLYKRLQEQKLNLDFDLNQFECVFDILLFCILIFDIAKKCHNYKPGIKNSFLS